MALAAVVALALGGTAIAGAAGDEEGDGGLSAITAKRAGQAALQATGGGSLGQMERDGEKGATYEVEVTKTDGSQVDVRLDERFKTVAIDSDGGDDD